MKTLSLLLLASALPAQTFTATVEGPPHDGDTVAIQVKSGIKPGAYRLRLFGADAPEISQAGGEESRRNLARLAPIGVTLRCELREWSYQRPVASCVAAGVDLSAAQVRVGHALVWTSARAKAKDWAGWKPAPSRSGKGAYIEHLMGLELRAADSMLGIWAGLADGLKPCPPWVYRKGGCQ